MNESHSSPNSPNEIVVPTFLEQPLALGTISEGLANIAFASQLQFNRSQYEEYPDLVKPAYRMAEGNLPIPRMPDGLFKRVDRHHNAANDHE